MGKRLSSDARREQLIEIGKTLFSTRPYDALSTEAIARDAGISKGLLYHYFGSKRGFYVATVQRLADELLAVTTLADDEPIEDAVASVLSGFYAFLGDHAALFRALVRGGIGSDPEVEGIIEAVRQTMLRRLCSRFGVETPTPNLRARLYAWIGAAEAAAVDLADHRDLDQAAFLAILLDLLVAVLPAELRPG
jgi:AcrR family transcriptional regulator